MGSPVRKYNVVQNGVETILKLNDTDARLYPDAELVEDQADDAEQPESKSRTAANKARRPAGDKSGG